ncbi:MAG TPA: choice-of-anchor V domain-containing protein [Aridibacter sp.]|nr:choice-of-anchor V domain-containing protein [Aridibacter sp.]
MDGTQKKCLIKTAVVFTVIPLIAAVYFGLSPNIQKVSGYVDGPPPSHTGAPGEFTCAVCHVVGFSELGGPEITITGLPAEYVPGENIQVTVTVRQTNSVAFGFQLTSIDSAGRQAGTFSIPKGNNQMQIISGPVGPNVRSYIEHTAAGTIPTVFNEKSWTFIWNAPDKDVGTIGFYAAGNAANGDGDSTGDTIVTTSETVEPAVEQASPAVFDFDGDGATDVSVFRPNSQPTAQWWLLRSSDQGTRGLAFGTSTDIPVAADFTGDGKTDVAFWRPSTGEWFILRSEDDSFFAFPFGSNGDIPAPGDFDGDGKADPAVYRPSSGTWFIFRSSDSQVSVVPFGVAADQPIVADYDGDGMDDVGVYRAPDNQFWLLRSTDGVKAYQFGAPGDRTAVGDWTGDGKADVAFFRPATSEWFVIRSEDDSFFAFPWGATGDIPSPGDYDGDGLTDPAVWRPSDRTWYIFGTTNGFEAVQFGSPGDVPLPSSVSVN